jgi:hypothetical protein
MRQLLADPCSVSLVVSCHVAGVLFKKTCEAGNGTITLTIKDAHPAG